MNARAAPRKKKSNAARYVKAYRLGKVSIYKRGQSYWLYFREGGKSIRKRIDGNLATARATASQVNAGLEKGQPSPFDFQTKPVEQTVHDFLEHCKLARGLRLRSRRRYRAALDHFLKFLETKPHFCNIDQVRESTVDDFVRYLHLQQRVRSGEKNGPRKKYTASGIAFILAVCRTLFNYARRRRLLSPYVDNPFASFPIEKLKARKPSPVKILARDQLTAFFEACDDWQFSVLFILSLYGMRAGELAHLLIADVDLAGEQFVIQSKPYLQWYVKTNRQRVLPILPEVRSIFENLIGDRKAGFVLLSRPCFEGRRQVLTFDNQGEFEKYIMTEEEGLTQSHPGASEVEAFNFTRKVLHRLGKTREDRIREEFMKVATQIGRSEMTMVHSLRHLFATLAEENGLNPLTVQTILGHSQMEMTRYYTHTGLEAKKTAVQKLLKGKGQLEGILAGRTLRRPDVLGDGVSAGTGAHG